MDNDSNVNRNFESDRIEKLVELRSRGPTYVNEANRDFPVEQFFDEYGDCDEFHDPPEQTLAGRVTRVNDLGSILFADIADETGRIQLFFYSEETPDFGDWGLIDVGDYVEAVGTPTRTDSGELSLFVTEWRIITKALRGVPNKTGFNKQNRVRDRVGALLVDEDLWDSVETRFDVIASLRTFLGERGFREVDTPIIHHTASGANATPFETYCEALDEEMALRIAPELILKQLVIGGFERIFEIGSCFRNEDIDTTHNPEFTLLELYEAFADYEDMMVLTEALVSSVVQTLTGSYKIEYDGDTLNFEPPWPRLSFEGTIEEYGGIPVGDLSDEDLQSVAEDRYGIEFDGGFSRGVAYMELYDVAAEGEIDGPLFVLDHPRESTPLCAPHREDESRVERFEVVVAGIELANAYSELTDPLGQAEAFAEQAARRKNGADTAREINTKFIEALGYGLPPTGGLGIGVDRLAMLVSDSQSIKDVLPFPLVAAENDRTQMANPRL